MKKCSELIIFGKHLRALREAKGFTQESFASIIEVNLCYYNAVERGEKNVAARNLIKIACALEVEVGELFPPLKKLSKVIK